MDPAEQALLQALESSPEDWSIRLLIAEKYQQREAWEEAAALVEASPVAPQTAQQLQQAVEYAGERALTHAKFFVANHPSDGYGHQVLGYLLEHRGEAEQAQKHYQAAHALGFSDGTIPDPVAECESHAPQFVEHAAPQGSAEPPPIATHPPQSDRIYPQDPVYLDQTPPPLKKKRASSKVTAVLVAIGVHVIIGIVAALLVILPPSKDEPEIVAAIIGPTESQREMQKKNVVKQVKKSTSASAAAAPVARLMRANAMAKFALPKVTKTSTGPLGMGEGNLGSGGFGGTVSGLGSGASFFGGTATGERFLFVLDHSASMKKNQVALRNKELDRALKSLKGVRYQVLLFAGAGYYAQKGWRIKGREIVTGPDGKTYRFNQKKISDFEFVGPDSKLPKAKWLDANSANTKATMDFVQKSPLFLGTDWEMALRIAHYMEPPPDVIFFMADGTGGNDPKPIIAVNKKRRTPVINTVAMQTAAGAAQFAAVAKGTKGKFTIVDKRGKPIDGFEFLKNPGKYKSRL